MPPKLQPGDINNYAYGYQDATGFGDRKKQKDPILSDDECYMNGWYSGAVSLVEYGVHDKMAVLRKEERKLKKEIEIAWKTWCKEHGIKVTPLL